MYGTIFNLDIKPGHHEALLKALTEDQATPDGMVAWFVMNPNGKDEWIGVAVFESKEAHVSNADSPAQHKTFLRIMEHLASEPTWNDGTYVIGKIA
ncbi:hypothetical protein M1N24_02390 [Dehalococcoidia bacterium]|nr:hypothetical protein [Dehalococcoidia bacterium]